MASVRDNVKCNIAKAVTIPVTTRAIGFGTTHTFTLISDYEKVPDRGNIYQLYRVCLALMEAKIQKIQRGVTCIETNEEDYTTQRQNVHTLDTIMSYKCIATLPDYLSSVINSIGKLNKSERLYVPKFAKDNYTPTNVFIPQSEQVTFSNLRRVVETLADDKTPVEFRRRFYNNNPIPGAIWSGKDNPKLLNPDEIIPAEYNSTDLDDDFNDISAKLNFLIRKVPGYFTNPVNFKIEGSKAILACNEQRTLRVSDRKVDEDLTAYYKRIKVEGDVEEYYNLERLTPDEQLEANVCLLGERPVISELIYPVYLLRDERVCIECSNLRYKCAMLHFMY